MEMFADRKKTRKFFLFIFLKNRKLATQNFLFNMHINFPFGNIKRLSLRIVNIDKKKYEINSLHVYSCYDFICKKIFVVRLSKNQYKSVLIGSKPSEPFLYFALCLVVFFLNLQLRNQIVCYVC
jgi:hypothetical protein